PGHDFYVVFNGAVEISKARPDGTAERLAARRKGDGFGEMALLNDAPRVSGRSSKRSWSA
ncbi:MAG: cyclic nucleotide-binding domain-containing protein, partial [Gemmatimonadota bacterium]|nr:cyclic nucleotide-binding domain-containing protein [Gemmatimonadota bacterium]